MERQQMCLKSLSYTLKSLMLISRRRLSSVFMTVNAGGRTGNLESMMMDLIQYKRPSHDQQHGKELVVSQMDEFAKRFDLLKQACKGSTSLLSEVDKLESIALESNNFVR